MIVMIMIIARLEGGIVLSCFAGTGDEDDDSDDYHNSLARKGIAFSYLAGLGDDDDNG